MAELDRFDQLNEAVEIILAGGAPAAFDSQLGAFAAVASALVDLPDEAFRIGLRQELMEESPMQATALREGFHTITPYLIVSGAPQIIDFISQVFGGEEVARYPRPDGLIQHAEVRLGDSMIELADATPDYPPRPTGLHVYVDDIDAAYARALEHGATAIHPPTDQEYGDRDGSVRDAAGNHWYIATRLATSPASHAAPLRTVTPYLHPSGAPKFLEFVKAAFGATEEGVYYGPDGSIVHAKIHLGDSIIEFSEAHGIYQPMPTGLHYYVRDTDAVYRRAIEAGATSIFEPGDKPYGERSGGVRDPFGNQWFIATPL
jgi:PhnB protein